MAKEMHDPICTRFHGLIPLRLEIGAALLMAAVSSMIANDIALDCAPSLIVADESMESRP